jgi:hypothetical protein
MNSALLRLARRAFKLAMLSYPRSGRSADWIKSKNPAAPAVKREAEEETSRPNKP